MDELVGYCQLSAVPVGRLVLSVFGVSTPERVALSDEVCIGLQLVEHLQDIAEDAARGRVYLPARGPGGLRRHRGRAAGSARQSLAPASGGVHVNRARQRLAPGRPLARGLPWPPRIAVAGFVGGGEAALDAIRHAGYDVLGHACRPRRLGVGARLAETLFAPSSNQAAA